MARITVFCILLGICTIGLGSEITTTVADSPKPPPATTTPATTTQHPTTTTPATTTTTSATTTTTPATTTTTLATTTTTLSPNTTTPSTNTTSTSPVPSTSTSPSTTAAPEPVPDIGSWVVVDEKNVTCIRAKMAVLFTIPIQKSHVYLALLPNATTIGSNCNVTEDIQQLVLTDDNVVFTIIFAKEKSSNKAYVQNLTLSYHAGDVKEYFSNSTELFKVNLGNSYQCKAETVVSLDDASAKFTDLKIQAFGKAGQDNFNIAEECESDNQISDVVPIAVGCALGALIIVVLIAYLVGRRKSRQRGYQSV